MAITLADFNKIWASTSPLTPYSFSESNYKQGWNFIGSTPPARQMWDFLQKNNDEKMQYLANNYLPLSGGTMSGTILKNGNFAKTSVDDSFITLVGGNTKGGILALYGKDHAAHGRFELVADDGSAQKRLHGNADGTLTWDGNKITVNDNTEDVTITTTANVVNTSAYNNAYRCGCVVTLGLSLYVEANVANGGTLITNLPKPKYNIGCALIGSTSQLRCYISTSGSLVLDGAGQSAREWFSACITYITTD